MAVSPTCQGRNPFTGKQLISAETCSNVLVVMGSCGMCDYSGQWLYNVGVPVKSGAGGGAMAVVPGQLGLAVYSLLLDHCGNSVRGIKLLAKSSPAATFIRSDPELRHHNLLSNNW